MKDHNFFWKRQQHLNKTKKSQKSNAAYFKKKHPGVFLSIFIASLNADSMVHAMAFFRPENPFRDWGQLPWEGGTAHGHGTSATKIYQVHPHDIGKSPDVSAKKATTSWVFFPLLDQDLQANLIQPCDSLPALAELGWETDSRNRGVPRGRPVTDDDPDWQKRWGIRRSLMPRFWVLGLGSLNANPHFGGIKVDASRW